MYIYTNIIDNLTKVTHILVCCKRFQFAGNSGWFKLQTQSEHKQIERSFQTKLFVAKPQESSDSRSSQA